VDCYTTALTLLSRRELSTAQLRARLARRKFESSEIDDVIERLAKDRTLDDRRVAIAAARMEGAIRRRGRRRVLQRVQQLGINATLAKTAVDEVFLDIDEDALLEQAVDRKLGTTDPRELDAKTAARIVRSLVAQGFEISDVCASLRAKGVSGL
jgi:regulatory protein